MKNKIILLAIILLTYTYANAQTYKEVEKTAKNQTEQMAKALDLTDDQESMIYRQNYTLLNQQARFNKLENKTEEAKSTMEKMKLDYKANVEKLLTDDQKAVFTNWAEKSNMLND